MIKPIHLILCFFACFSAASGAFKNRTEMICNSYSAASTDESVRRLLTSLDGRQGERSLDTYATEYFFNLRRNFPYNSHGTCSFVAASMMLSFWDSYMNDDFVPENYEVNTSYIPQTSDDEPRFLQPFGSESPGFKSEESVEVEGLSRTEYSSHLLQHTETNFQAYLLVWPKTCLVNVVSRMETSHSA